jgi:hypothetical protein
MSTDTTGYVIPPPPQAAIAIAGSSQTFPVRRIWCVGRNYEEHIKEMGHDVRDPPFFFSKPADAVVPDGATVPYPPLTKDMHHEVELVVALKSGGRNIKLDKALDCIWGYGVGIDLTRRDLQIASRDMKRPWEIGKAFDAVRAAAAGGEDRPSEQGLDRAQGQRQAAPGRRPRADDLERPRGDREAFRDGRARGGRRHHDRHALGGGRDGGRRHARVRDRRRRQAHGDDRPAGEVRRREGGVDQPSRLALSSSSSEEAQLNTTCCTITGTPSSSTQSATC